MSRRSAHRRSRDSRTPERLESSCPRDVRLTAGGKALLVLAISLVAGGLAGGVALHVKSARQTDARRLLNARGVNAKASVTRLWRTSGESGDRRVAVAFQVDGRSYDRSAKAPLRLWRTLRVGSTLPVRYLPSDPRVNSISGITERTMSPFIAWGVGAALIIAGLLVTLPILHQRRLLQYGRSAQASVTRVTSGEHGKTLHYHFRSLSGIHVTGESATTKKTAQIGDRIWVVYDPEHRSRSAMFPFSLVKPAR